MKNLVYKPLAQASVIRSFTILFLLASIIPLGVLTFLYFELLFKGSITLSATSLQYALILVALGCGVGFLRLRTIITNFIETTRVNRRVLSEILGPDVLPIKDGEFNEIQLLAQTFQHIKSRLESDNENLKYLANTDSLTGLSNHRYFMTILDYEVSRIKRYGGTLCLLMIDVDHFKKYNDTHGHLDGDRLLKEIAGVFKQYLRSVDVCSRYGGDEFAILLPATDIQGARRVAEKIKNHVEALTLRNPVTLSIGGFKWNDQLSAQDFLVSCDQALYAAKNAGRNTIIVQ